MSVLFVVSQSKTFGKNEKACGWYLPTVCFAYHKFVDAGIKVTFCSTSGGEAPCDPESSELWSYTLCEEFLMDRPVMTLLANTVSIKEVDPAKYNIIYFAGGFGPLFDIYNNADMKAVTAKIFENGGIVSSVGMGAAGLLNVKLSNGKYLIDGKKCTGYTNAELSRTQFESLCPFKVQTELSSQGGKFEYVEPRRIRVVTDGQIITGQNCTSTADTALAIIAAHEVKTGGKAKQKEMEALLVVTNCSYLGDGSVRTGWSLPTVVYPYNDLVKLGVKVTFVSPYGGNAPLDQESATQWADHADCAAFVQNKEIMDQFKSTAAIRDVDPSKYSIIVFAGGFGAMVDCVDNEIMNRVVCRIYENGGIVSSIDNGGVGLLNVKLSDGKWLVQNQVVSAQADEEIIRLEQRHYMPFLLEQSMRDQGALFSEGTPVKEHVATSNCGRLVTGQNPNSSINTAHALVKAVKQLRTSLRLTLYHYDNVVNFTKDGKTIKKDC